LDKRSACNNGIFFSPHLAHTISKLLILIPPNLVITVSIVNKGTAFFYYFFIALGKIILTTMCKLFSSMAYELKKGRKNERKITAVLSKDFDK